MRIHQNDRILIEFASIRRETHSGWKEAGAGGLRLERGRRRRQAAQGQGPEKPERFGQEVWEKAGEGRALHRATAG
jgi:hypothetical protein